MDRIRLPLAALALALALLAACQSTPTAPVAPRENHAAIISHGDSTVSGRGGNLIGSGN